MLDVHSKKVMSHYSDVGIGSLKNQTSCNRKGTGSLARSEMVLAWHVLLLQQALRIRGLKAQMTCILNLFPLRLAVKDGLSTIFSFSLQISKRSTKIGC